MRSLRIAASRRIGCVGIAHNSVLKNRCGDRNIEQPPGKWEVYEQILRVPYYAVFDSYKYEFRMFRLDGSSYAQIALSEPRF